MEPRSLFTVRGAVCLSLALLLSAGIAAQVSADGTYDSSSRGFVTRLLDETPLTRMAGFRRLVQTNLNLLSYAPRDQGPGSDGRVALHFGGVRAGKTAKAVKALIGAGRFNLSDPITVRYAEMVENYLAPWRGIDGVTDGMGSGRGIISPEILESMANKAHFMSCCGHIKVVGGKVYSRVGGFVKIYYRMLRFLKTVKTIELAINEYGLKDTNAEFLVNTCDFPMSFDSSVAGSRGGYPVFSTEWTPGSVDILFPDPLDLSGDYMTKSPEPVPWEFKKSKAVFRGATTNYDIHKDSNWRASPRLRLHKMSEIRPDLIDAKVSRWSHLTERATINKMGKDGLHLGQPLGRRDLDHFKYELVVDGGGGSCRTCGVLGSDRAMIRQDSSFQQFFQPLLEPYVHFIPTKHFWEDTYDQIQWAQEHDAEVQRMVFQAHRVARAACTWSGRALYWAVLLVKYSKEAMEAPEQVLPPQKTCSYTFKPESMSPKGVQDPSLMALKWPIRCEDSPTVDVSQPQCVFFCIGNMRGKPRPWLSSAALKDIVLQG